MRISSIATVIAGAIAGAVVALIIAGTGSSTSTVTDVVSSPHAVPTSLKGKQSTSGSTTGMSINQIYRADSPGVVDIKVVSQVANSGSSGGLFGFGNSGSSGGGGGTEEEEGEGAGVVLNKSGDIITDEHVVANATKVTVTFSDGKTASAKVLGSDASTDVGVIKVNVPASELHPIAFANSNDAQIGDPVVAIGSPFALPETVTSGIVSHTGRPITAPNGFTILDAIQTDAAINPGNSGGPLLDAAGQVLGLNDQIETNSGADQSSGVGFATPGNTDLKIADEIISGKKVRHSYVGVCLNSAASGGAQIATTGDSNCSAPVEPGSPAAKAGLKPGDLITAVDGKTITSTDDFIEVVGNYAPGQTVTLTVKHDGTTKQVKVTLGVRPATAPSGG